MSETVVSAVNSSLGFVGWLGKVSVGCLGPFGPLCQSVGISNSNGQI